MTSASAAKEEKFMAARDVRAEALPWLDGVPANASVNWVGALRETGAKAFSYSGLPTPSQEGWQYTNLRPLAQKTYTYNDGPASFDPQNLPPPMTAEGYRIVLVNGQYQEDLSKLPPHIEVASLMTAAEQKWAGLEDHLARVGGLEDAPFEALNAAYLQDGFVLRVLPHQDVQRAVEVLFYNHGDDKAPVAAYPRVLYMLGENSDLTVWERHTGKGHYFVDSFIALAQESSSRLRHYRFVEETPFAVHIDNTVLSQKKNAVFEGFSIATGGGLTRQEYRLLLLDRENSANISGIYLVKGQQSHDFTILADHFEPGGVSAQHFKGVIDGKARAVFQGKIHVRRSAQKTDGYQSHHALLLSREAQASAKPELEIYADDVKCSHGATSGFIDPVALFYLRSRGIPQREAQSLLVNSFLNEVVGKVSDDLARDVYLKMIADWLAAREET